MARLNPDEHKARTQRIAKLTSAYADGYRTGLQRNQFGERTRMEGIASHSQCMSGKSGYSAEWTRGYRDGFEGTEPTPKRGREKGEGPAKDERIMVRCTAEQKAAYDKRGGNDWLLGLL